jgi:hypothetical protein
MYDDRNGGLEIKVEMDLRDQQGKCKTCEGSAFKNKDGKSEVLILCAKCGAPSKFSRFW